MRFFLVLGWVCLTGMRSAWAQVDAPMRTWTNGAASPFLYGAAPLVLALVGVAAVQGLRYVRRIPGGAPLAVSVYGLKSVVWTAVVLLSGLGLSAYRVQVVQQQTYASAWLGFQQEMDRVEADIQTQFESLLPVLRGIRGLVVASERVSNQQFRDWVASRDLEHEYPGVSGFGIVEPVGREDVPSFVATQRHGGAPDFVLTTSGQAADLFIVKYVEPLASNRAFLGVDLGALPVARAAAEHAMRSGQPALSVDVRVDHGGQSRPEILYFLPMYAGVKVPATETERVKAFRGWAYASVVMGDLMAHTVGVAHRLTAFAVFDGLEPAPSRLMFDSGLASGRAMAGDASARAMFSAERPLVVNGQFFQLRVHTTPEFERLVDLNAPARLAFTGSALAVFASLVVWLLLVGRARAEALARSMTQDLDRLALVARRTSNAVVIADARQCITWVNAGFTRMTGYSEQEAVGKNLGMLRSENADPAALAAVQRALEAGQTCRQVLINRAKSGRDYWVDLEIQPLCSSTGQVTGCMSLESDVTAQVQVQEALAREKERADGILLGANVGTWQRNAQTQEGWANAQWSAMLGFAPEDAGPRIWEFWERLVQPDDLVRSNNSMAACLRGDTDAYACEMRVQRKDGSWMWILSRAKVLTHTSDGRPEWLAGIHMDITQSKRTEERLRDMEAFLRRAGRAAEVGAWQIDLQNRVIIWSAQTCEIHGVEPGFKPSMEQALSFYPKDARAALEAAIAHAAATGIGWDLTSPFVSARGEQLWVRSVGEVEFDDRGAARLVGAFQNVTQAQETQRRIERSEALLRGAIDAINEAFVLYDPQDQLVFCNEKYRNLYAKSVDLIVPGATFESIVRGGAERGQYPAAVGRVDAWVAERMRAHRAGYASLEQRLESGQWLRVVERTMPDGHIVGFRVDITELKNATEAAQSVSASLAQTMALLQNVLDSAVDLAVIAMDLHRKITVFNKGAERLLGYQADEVLGKYTASHFFDLHQLAIVKESMALLLGHEPTADEVFAEVLRSKDASEWTFVRQDGRTLTVSLMTSPMLDASGELIGHLGLAYDISRQKEYEDSLRSAMIQAEQASVAKSQFLANMSHEIRTPMNAILGMLRLLHNTPLTDRQSDYAAKAEVAARSLLGLLNDILDFSKVEAGKMQLDIAPFQVDTLLAELSVILSSNLGAKNVDVLFDIDPAIPPVLLGDAQRIKQVLINLGGNAVKFTAQGEVIVRWRLLARSADRVTLEVAVCDSGIGIAPENQTRIFEGFSQAEASTTRRFGGTGLGLVISQKMVALMGGKLSLSSVLGQGSTFSFQLGLGLPLLSSIAPMAHTGIALAAAPVTRVLLVDDNAAALATSAALMRSLQWEVTEARSGEQALQQVKKGLQQGAKHFDLVCIDGQMSGMDGWQTLRSLRRLYGEGELPKMVMLSGQGRELLARRTHREQELLDGFLVKPLTASMFLDVFVNAQNRHPPSLATSPASAQQGLHGMRILVVEDNPINQQVAQELLSAQGALVSLAENGRVGVDAVAAAQPQFDVVLMDLQMPVMGGLEATRVIRQDLGLTRLPVIAMTANAMASDRAACLDAGMNDHVGKPFDLNHLMHTLLRHVHWDSPHSGAQVVAPLLVGADTDTEWPQGVDVASALARMGGNTGLLLRTLRAFVRDAKQIADKLEWLLASGDRGAAQRELHALKGLAATLGAEDLSASAAQAEAAMRQTDVAEMPQPWLARLRSSVARCVPLLESVALRLEPVPPVAAHAANGAATYIPLDTAAMRDQLGGLRKALRNADMQAMELHAAFRQAFGEGLGASMDALDAAMAELDFDLAAAQCGVLIDRFRPPPSDVHAPP